MKIGRLITLVWVAVLVPLAPTTLPGEPCRLKYNETTGAIRCIVVDCSASCTKLKTFDPETGTTTTSCSCLGGDPWDGACEGKVVAGSNWRVLQCTSHNCANDCQYSSFGNWVWCNCP